MTRHRVSEVELGLRRYLTDVGYWQGARAETHAFVLSPEVRVLSVAEQAQLEALATGIPPLLAAVERATEMVAAAERNGGCRGSLARFQSFLHAGSLARAYREAQTTFSCARPDGGVRTPAVKLDVLCTARGFRLVEIDGWNPRAIGFMPLVRDLAVRSHRLMTEFGLGRVLPECATFYGGVVDSLVHALHERGCECLTILLSLQERFYEPSFERLAYVLREQGIDVQIVPEGQSVYEDAVRSWRMDARVALLALPASWNGKQDAFLLEEIARYAERILIPPKPLWSSKGLLALVSRPSGWAREILGEAGYTEADRATFAQHLPRTWFPSSEDRLPMIKRVHSAGSHGVTFPDGEGDTYRDAYQGLVRGAETLDCVFQEPVSPVSRTYRTFHGDRFERLSGWRERYIVHVRGVPVPVDADTHDANATKRGHVLDVHVTARRDRNVHLQKDAIQVAAVREATLIELPSA